MSGASMLEPGLANTGEVPRGFVRVALGAIGYTLLVVLFGAVVRITGSGAGCGQHWPTCHGEVAHMPQSVETLIELTHRITSGLCLPLVIGLWIWALVRFPAGHATRRYAAWTVALMVVEALVGASLVLLELVGENSSASRAGFMAVHLVSTSALMGVMVLVAWTAARGQAGADFRFRAVDTHSRVLGWLLLGFVAVSMLGAITALGDTLYPVAPGADLADRLHGSHFLERLRIAHPVTAIGFAAAVWWLTPRFADVDAARRRLDAGGSVKQRGSGHERAGLQPGEPSAWVWRVRAVLALQLVVGVVNVALSAPGYMQVTHLAVGTLLWVCLVLLFASHVAAAETR